MRNWKGLSIEASLGAMMTIASLFAAGGCGSSAPVVVDRALFAEYPREGDATSYGMPLSMKNAARFIDYYGQYSLTPTQEAVKYDALSALVAPCCDDQTMYTCCCPCNLAKTVWGLSAYLIVEKDCDSLAVREAALQWLRFIRRDYYKAVELEEQGLDPRAYGLRHSHSCYEGRCELPFRDGGCGGMVALVEE